MANETDELDLPDISDPIYGRHFDAWTDKQRFLLNWFQKRAESLADSYEGAVILLHNLQFPGRIHFISHAVRDIADRLVFVLDPELKSSRVQYENEMDEIIKEWPISLDRPESSDSPNVLDTVEITYSLARRLDTLVNSHRKALSEILCQLAGTGSFHHHFLYRRTDAWMQRYNTGLKS